MAAFDFKKLAKDSAQFVKDNAAKAQDALSNVDFQATANELVSKSKDVASTIAKKTDEAIKAFSDANTKKRPSTGMLSAQGCIKLLYLMMSADGVISDEERDQLNEIGYELDKEYTNYQQELMAECISLISKVDNDSYQDELKDIARDIISESIDSKASSVPAKLLLWNLLVIALCDKSYDESEAAFVRYIARHLEIDKSIVPEMENSIRALTAVENEITWLKSTDRPFGTVEPEINELTDRKNAIMQGVMMLISE